MKFNIEQIKRKMLVKYPFFGSIVANVDYKENLEIETAGTDGTIVYYNPKFLENLSSDEQIFIFAHEICHIAFNHIKRSEGKDSEVWNLATDGVINQFLKRDGLKVVPGGVDMPDAIKYDAEELYEKLLRENQSGRQGSLSNSNNQSNSQSKASHDVGHDTHKMWKEGVKKEKSTSSKNKNASQSDNGESKNEQQKAELQQEITKISKMGETKAYKKNLEERRKKLENLKQALSKQAMGAGTTTNGEQRIIDNIGKSKPIIDWRYILRETIQYDVDWSYRNAYVEDGVVSANLEEYPISETEILLDTSGSINQLLLKNFLRECKNILKHSKLKVGCFDTKFYGFHEVIGEDDIENMRLEGGGGTNFDVAVESFTRRVENKIIFTDGNAKMPDISMNVIWIVFGEHEINPKGGRVIQINEEQLDRLYSYKKILAYKKKDR